MSPRAAAGSTEAQGDAEVIPAEPMPAEAEPLRDVIDRRYKYLLCLTSTPKALTDALEGAAEWEKIKSQMDGAAGEGWGTGLPKNGTVTRNG